MDQDPTGHFPVTQGAHLPESRASDGGHGRTNEPSRGCDYGYMTWSRGGKRISSVPAEHDLAGMAKQRLTTAGLIGAPVTALLLMDVGSEEIVQVTVLDDASDADLGRVREAMAGVPHEIVLRPLALGVRYVDRE